MSSVESHEKLSPLFHHPMESPISKEKDTTTRSQVDPIQPVQSDDKESREPLNDEAPPEYLHGFKLFIVLVALLLSMLLVLLSLTEKVGFTSHD